MITAYVGLPGTGKTYGLVLEALKGIKQERKVYSNFDIAIDGIVRIKGFSDLVKVRDGLVILDELNLWFPSRLWQSIPPEILSLWAQSRKRGIDLIYSTQHLDRVDKVIREVTNYVIRCNSVSLFSLQFFIYTTYQPEDWDKQNRRSLGRRIVLFRQSVASLYDTYQIIEDIATILEREAKLKSHSHNRDLGVPIVRGVGRQ